MVARLHGLFIFSIELSPLTDDVIQLAWYVSTMSTDTVSCPYSYKTVYTVDAVVSLKLCPQSQSCMLLFVYKLWQGIELLILNFVSNKYKLKDII